MKNIKLQYHVSNFSFVKKNSDFYINKYSFCEKVMPIFILINFLCLLLVILMLQLFISRNIMEEVCLRRRVENTSAVLNSVLQW